MLKDYSASSTSTKAKKSKPSSDKLSKLLISAVLFSGLILFLFLVLNQEFEKIFRLKENQRILLIQNQEPIAILSFKVEEKQLLITDLKDFNFEMNLFLQEDEKNLQNSERNLFYSFILQSTFDQVLDYPLNDLNKESLLSFFKIQKPFYLFLKHPNLLIREHKFNGELPTLSDSFFDCPIALINTTSESGLATTLANILQKSSYSVIKKDNNQDNLSQTKILYDPNVVGCVPVLDKLSKFLPSSLLEKNEEVISNYRAAVVVYVGQDLAQLYVFFVDLFHREL